MKTVLLVMILFLPVSAQADQVRWFVDFFEFNPVPQEGALLFDEIYPKGREFFSERAARAFLDNEVKNIPLGSKIQLRIQRHNLVDKVTGEIYNLPCIVEEYTRDKISGIETKTKDTSARVFKGRQE